MIVSDIVFKIEIAALKEESGMYSYLVEVDPPGRKVYHCAVSKDRSIGHLISKICKELEEE